MVRTRWSPSSGLAFFRYFGGEKKWGGGKKYGGSTTFSFTVERLGLHYRRFPPAARSSSYWMHSSMSLVPGTPRYCKRGREKNTGRDGANSCSASAHFAPPRGDKRPAAVTPNGARRSGGGQEKLRRAAGRIVSRRNPCGGLLLCAKHLFVAAILAGPPAGQPKERNTKRASMERSYDLW